MSIMEGNINTKTAEKIKESLNDPRPDLPMSEVFAKLRFRLALMVKSGSKAN